MESPEYRSTAVVPSAGKNSNHFKGGRLRATVAIALVAMVTILLFCLYLFGQDEEGILGNCGRFQDCTTELILQILPRMDRRAARPGGMVWGQPHVQLNNIAEGRPARQSSTGQGRIGLARHATDGNRDGDLRHGSCTHTADATGVTLGSDNPWWRVDLSQTAPITAVHIWNRQDCCSERLKGVEVWVSNTSWSFTNGTRCEGPHDDVIEAGRPITRSCQGTPGQYVWAHLLRNNTILTLCEVEVLSTAKPLPPDPCFDPSVMTRRVDFADPSVKYLMYEKSLDFCCGASHKTWSYSCAFGEAAYLNRTFVLDFGWCLDAVHTGLPYNVVKDLRLYYNMAVLRRLNVVPREAFLCYMEEWKRKHKEDVPTLRIWNPRQAPFVPELAKEERTVIQRFFYAPYYYFDVCNSPANYVIQRDYALQMSPELYRIVFAIQEAMGWDYDAVHVRRGDKARQKDKWPNVDHDTQPESLLQKLPKFIANDRNLYIATDENAPHFFDPLATKYKIFMLSQFAYLWGPGTAWYTLAEDLQRRNGRTDYVHFDSYPQALVDYSLLNGAKRRVETFNDLTSDNRHATG